MFILESNVEFMMFITIIVISIINSSVIIWIINNIDKALENNKIQQ